MHRIQRQPRSPCGTPRPCHTTLASTYQPTNTSSSSTYLTTPATAGTSSEQCAHHPTHTKSGQVYAPGFLLPTTSNSYSRGQFGIPRQHPVPYRQQHPHTSGQNTGHCQGTTTPTPTRPINQVLLGLIYLTNQQRRDSSLSGELGGGGGRCFGCVRMWLQ